MIKILSKPAFFSAMIISFAFALGCTSVSYDGKTFAPTSSVEVVKKQKGIPDGYELMGHAVASAPADEGGSQQDLEKKLIQKAKDKGADAVMTILYEQVKTGEERDDQLMNTSPVNTGWGMDVDTEGDIRMIDSANTAQNRGDRMGTPVYKAIMKAVFLKKTEKKMEHNGL
ncbi:MAG: hypothetical protein WAX69_25610 [Victivallales bacterium]